MNANHLPPMFEVCLAEARADRAMRGVVAKQLASYQLTMMEWLALASIGQSSRDGVSMSDIAATLDVTLPQVTALVGSLIQAKFAKQRVLSSDRRGRQVSITLKGKRTLSKLEVSIRVAMGAWTQAIPPADLRAYNATVKRLAEQR